MTQTTYAVTGMTCEHCVSSVREELGELPGVRRIDVDLGTGNVQVTSERVLDRGQVERAIRTAGYQLLR